MARDFEGTPRLSLPKPSRALMGVMVGLLAIWVVFAVGVNWGGASFSSFEALAGNTQAIANGELWRLFTAPLLHHPESSQGVQHIAFSLLGIYFLAPALESVWGTPRLLRFLGLSAVLAYIIQWTIAICLPASWSGRLVPPLWYGSTPVLEALVIAYALSLRNRSVLLFFVLPVGSKALILATVCISFLLLLADALGPAGHVAPFAGMLMGWWLGGSTPSPARRLWLRWRLGRLDAEVRRSPTDRSRGASRRHLQVIEGGRDPEKSRRNRGGRSLH